jgi:N12 class adenine-specific DNA methylase
VAGPHRRTRRSGGYCAKRGIWRIIAAGSTNLAHAVGAGKTMTIAAAIMEHRRLGLIAKAMRVVPGHRLARPLARSWRSIRTPASLLPTRRLHFS